MTELRTVGILAGMGPETTLTLMERVKTAVNAVSDQDHVPLLVDMNTQVPTRISAMIGADTDAEATDPGPILVAMAKRMQESGAEALAMPCNGAHKYAELISSEVNIPLLDMVVLTSDAAGQAAGSGGKVGLLGSPALQQSGIFDAAIGARGGTVVYPEDQGVLLDAIREIKATGPTPSVRDKVVVASHNLLWQGAQVQLVACTEFSLLKRAMDPGAFKIDALDVLVKEIVEFSRGIAA